MKRTRQGRCRWAARPAIVFGIVVGIISLPCAGAAWSAGLLEPATSLDMQAAAAQPAPMGNLAVRSRLVRVNRTELARHVAPLGIDTALDRVARAQNLDGVVTLQLFPNVVATFKRTSLDTIGDSGYAWTGEIDGPLNFASLIVDDGQITGHIQLLHHLYKIEPLGNGVHRVSEIDAKRFPPEAKPVPLRKSLAPTIAPGANDLRTREQRAKTQIRILVAYTKKARNQNANIINDIKQAIQLANTAFNNTRIPIRFVLAATMSTRTYPEAGSGSTGFSNDLNNLNGSNGSVLANVRNKRNAVQADLVSLFRSSDNDICGIANHLDNLSAGTSNVAYSVLNWQCVSNLSFHHEAGHNMSLRHDYYVDPVKGRGYNHGYVNIANKCRIRTVMGYNNACVDKKGFNCTRVNVFSTAKFVWKIGNTNCAIGIAKDGLKKAADNTQRLKEVRTIVGNYR
jgi:hypothetical protein